MIIRRVMLCLTVAAGTFLGMPATGAAASGQAEREIINASSPAQVSADWNHSGWFSNDVKCNDYRMNKVRQGNPTLPTDGCYRDVIGYYYLWWG
jgi:hypothetical protein